MADPPRCTICLAEPAIHFHLIHNVRTDGLHSSRGAGSIDLCQRCWREATDQARRKLQRPHLRRVRA